MRRLVPLALAAGVLAGCGQTHSAATPAVSLTVSQPGDATRVVAQTVNVQGAVSPPGATVLVAGRPASVTGGSFSAQVSLRPGTNVVDVMASAPGTRASMTAIRVFRQVTVQLPDLAGSSPADAKAQLQGLGLKAQVNESGGLLETILPSDPSVCSTTPPAGAVVTPGSTVQVEISKTC